MAAGLEVSAALTQPQQRGTTSNYKISDVEFNPKRRVLIGEVQGILASRPGTIRNGDFLATILPTVFPERSSSLTNDQAIFAKEIFTSFEIEGPIDAPANLLNRDYSTNKISQEFGPFRIRYERGHCSIPGALPREVCFAIGLRNEERFPSDTFPGIASVIVSDRLNADLFKEGSEKCVFYARNSKDIYDTNNDGVVTSSDSLAIINEISRNSRTGGPAQLSDGSCPPTKFFDVDGNGALTSRDSIQVINEISRRNRSK